MTYAPITDDLTVQDLTLESVEDLENVIDRIGTLQREVEEKQAEKNREIVQVERRHAPVIKRRTDRLKVLRACAVAFAKSHKGELLEDSDGKTAQLLTGEVSYKKGRSKLVYTDDKEAVIERLREIGRGDLVVIKETLHKKPLMKAWPDVQGVKGLDMEEGEERITITPLAA